MLILRDKTTTRLPVSAAPGEFTRPCARTPRRDAWHKGYRTGSFNIHISRRINWTSDEILAWADGHQCGYREYLQLMESPWLLRRLAA